MELIEKYHAMGKFTIESETAFAHSPEKVYDFVSNPANWGSTYSGSGGVHQDLRLPLQVSDEWVEKVTLPPNTYSSKWRLVHAARPRKFTFTQVNKIGEKEDGEGGVEGFCTIEYNIEVVGHGVTLFKRSLTCELPKGVGIPDDLLTVCCRPDGIDKYHSNVEKKLDEEFGRATLNS